MKHADVQALCLGLQETVGTAIASLKRSQAGIVLLLEDDRQLRATIRDADIRLALMEGLKLDTLLTTLVEQRPEEAVVTAPEGLPEDDLRKLMHQRSLRQLPLVDPAGAVTGLLCERELTLPIQAVIMAGGLGLRLNPLTDEVPKPMLSVGDQPLLERLVAQLRDAGVRRIHIATHFQEEKIVEHFGDGAEHGVELSYVREEEPLGTAGALGLVDSSQPLLVVNGDILTQVDFRALLNYHRQQAAAITLGVRRFELEVPYGVLKTEGAALRAIVEKPVQSFVVNAGIYLIEPQARAQLPPGQRCDMPELIQRAIAAQQSVMSFLIWEYWLDVGGHPTYQQAQTDVAEGGSFHSFHG